MSGLQYHFGMPHLSERIYVNQIDTSTACREGSD
jgi:hypothetical protein